MLISPIFAQCDTLPVATRWESKNRDYSYVDFTAAIDHGAPPEIVFPDSPAIRGRGEHLSVISYPNGKPKYIFNGHQLRRGSDYSLLAGGVAVGADSSSSSTSLGESVYQHTMLPLPGDTNSIYIFHCLAYRTPTRPVDSAWENNLPALLSIYDARLDRFTLRDSILHDRATESWAAVRHTDGESWWLASRVHSPSATRVYKLTVEGLQPDVYSLGGSVYGWRGPEEAAGIAFSPSGLHIGWAVRASSRFDSIAGEHWVADFDCANGHVTNYVQLDDNLLWGGGGSVCFSPQGTYLYGIKDDSTGFIFDNDIHRYSIDLNGGGNHGTAEHIFNTAQNLGVALGPDGRVYGGPNSRLRYIDYPDRWQALTDPTTLTYPGGAIATTLPPDPWVAQGLNPQQAAIDLPLLRLPRLGGDNFVACGDTLAYSVLENCYQELAQVTYEVGPGITVVDDGKPSLIFAFDTLQTLDPVRYVALANNHPCRTYRDTFWVYVEGCEQTCAPVTTAAQLTACDSASVHGIWQSTSGDYSQTFQSFSGCDSTSTISLTISPSVATATSITACDSTLVHGIWQSSSGDYSQTFQSFTGCDSTSTISLSISPSVATAASITACDSVQVHGIWQSTSGNYSQTFQSFSGCDSTSTISLSISSSISTTASITACDSTLIHGQLQSSSGDYSQTYQSFTGCDSTSTISLSISSVLETAEELIACDSARIAGQWLYESGEHEQAYSSVQGCDSIHTTTVTIVDSPVRPPLPQDTLLQQAETLQLILPAAANLAYTWQPAAAVDCADCARVEVAPSFEGRLSLEVSDDQGCSTLAAMLVLRAPEPNKELWAPTAFSPNGDGVNDIFSIALPAGASLLSCTVYDRWGNSLSAAVGVLNAPPGELLPVWDGTFRGNMVNPGVFVWQAEWRDMDGIEQLATGEVTLLR